MGGDEDTGRQAAGGTRREFADAMAHGDPTVGGRGAVGRPATTRAGDRPRRPLWESATTGALLNGGC